MLKQLRPASITPVRPSNLAREPRNGYTLIEFLVIIAMMAILIGTALPAIQASRETSRRVMCRHHLRQVGLALQSYHDAFERWPAGSLDPKSPIRNQPEGYHHGWLTHLLPYLDEPIAAEHLDRAKGIYADENRAVVGRPLSMLNCPSDPGPEHGTTPHGAALTSYAAVHDHRVGPVDTTNSGAFIQNRFLSRRDIPDGLSQMLFVGEINRGKADLGWASGTQGSLRNTGTAINSSRVLGAAAEDVALPEVGGGLGGDNDFWMEDDAMALEGASSDESSDASNRPPAVPRPAAPLHSTGGFSSAHVSGAYFLFGDARVVFLSQSIDDRVFNRLTQRADGIVVEQEF